MYIPKHFLNEDQEDILAFVKKYSFGVLISAKDGYPMGTHLPFLVKKVDDEIYLYSHFSAVNPQAKIVSNELVMVIFAEPHAYISPKFYESEKTVPTWNYLAVHAYGTATTIEEESEKFTLLEETIVNYEEEYLDQWNNLPEDFKAKLLKGIVGFKIKVSELQGKNKLSQNRTETERTNIIKAFSKSTDENERQIGALMEKASNNKSSLI